MLRIHCIPLPIVVILLPVVYAYCRPVTALAVALSTRFGAPQAGLAAPCGPRGRLTVAGEAHVLENRLYSGADSVRNFVEWYIYVPLLLLLISHSTSLLTVFCDLSWHSPPVFSIQDGYLKRPFRCGSRALTDVSEPD